MQTIQLEDYVIPKKAIPLPGGKQLEVRGLCADDLTFLVSLHLPEITKALKLYQESRSDILTSGNISQFVMTLARDFPGLVAEVISAAADSLTDKARVVAGRLPVATQIIILNEIVTLTMEDAGGLGNLLAEMRERLVKAAASVEQQS
jgi:hypothetical protein